MQITTKINLTNIRLEEEKEKEDQDFLALFHRKSQFLIQVG